MRPEKPKTETIGITDLVSGCCFNLTSSRRFASEFLEAVDPKGLAAFFLVVVAVGGTTVGLTLDLMAGKIFLQSRETAFLFLLPKNIVARLARVQICKSRGSAVQNVAATYA
ncbi:hypothetical protein [Burkholderia gladioli]|uniref:hypothetical protein n=1 Tax=Burkholderia gladioli TaxID=28095 RepID=UPI001640C9AA|nr:hypothetical protein [Burkholderia gladioli]